MLNILASGCSHTDANFQSLYHPEMDCTWPKWPELFAQKLGVEYKLNNIGLMGLGNERIFKKTLYQSLKDDYDIILVLWAALDRIDLFDTYSFMIKSEERLSDSVIGVNANISKEAKDHLNRNMKSYDWVNQGIKDKIFQQKYSILPLLHNSLLLKKYCEKRGITLIQAMSSYIHEKETVVYFLLDEYDKFAPELENDPSTIGFPFVEKFGGTSMRREIEKVLGKNGYISEKDYHFNSRGHEIVADVYYQRYLEICNT